MSISFSGSFTRAGGIASAIGKQLKSVNLKPVKKIVYTFDPFRPNVKTVRDCLFMFSSDKILATNPRCILKTEIVDNSEPHISVLLEQGKEIIIKTENLNILEVLQEYNKIVVPLIPKEEEITGKIAGKIANIAAAGGKKPVNKPAAAPSKKK